MKILFDHQIFSSQVHGGVSKYFAEILNIMPRNTWELSAWLSNNEYALNYRLFKQFPFLPNTNFRGKGRIMAELGKPYSLKRIKNGDFDVFHQTNFDDYCFSALGNRPMVTTYHDVNFLTEKNYNERMKKLQTKSLIRADKVIAISQNTKNDMLQFFNINPEKIEVIHHGISADFVADSKMPRLVNEPYILFVGMRHAFKNFENFIKAFARIADKYEDIKVVCTREPFTVKEWELFKSLRIENRVKNIRASEKTLATLYRDALFFVFPSTYEGFGMPILEAMINKCPVVCANTSCFPEIAQNAAIYFDPYDIDSIASAMDILLNDSELRKNYCLLGLEHAKRFSWKETASKHIEVYKSLL